MIPMPTKQATKKSPKNGSAGLTAEEKAAMKEMLKERKTNASKAEAEGAVMKAIKAMPPADRALAEQIHAMVKRSAPTLDAKTWYGFPAYADAEGDVVCFFKAASKFKERYATFGFNTAAKLDEGGMWVTSFALVKLTPADEAKLAALVKKAVS